MRPCLMHDFTPVLGGFALHQMDIVDTTARLLSIGRIGFILDKIAKKLYVIYLSHIILKRKFDLFCSVVFPRTLFCLAGPLPFRTSVPVEGSELSITPPLALCYHGE